MLLMNWVVGSSEVICEGYTMSKRVDKKIQSKVKYLEANLLWISSGAGKFGEGVTLTNDDASDKEIYLSKHDLSKFASSMNEIRYF
jgi:hypothetical protein